MASLVNFLSPLFPSTTITTSTNTPKFPPQTSSSNPSTTLLSISPSQTRQQVKPISVINDELYQSDVMAVVCPSLAYSNTLFFNNDSYNVEISVDDNEPEERLLNRFRREVMRAGIIQECKRRRHFENRHDKKKRKSREAAKRNSRRRRGPPPRFEGRDEAPKVEKNEDDGDNWEMPQDDSPF